MQAGIQPARPEENFMRPVHRLLLVPTLWMLAVPAQAAKVEHTQITPPKLALEAPAELAAIGTPTRMMEHAGALYVAGVNGIAAMTPDGRLLWATPLDPVGVREIAADDAGIAYTGYQVTGTKTTGLSFFGGIPDKLVFAPSTMGMLTPGGVKAWEVQGPASRISAPCLSPESVGVLLGEKFHISARADGKVTISKADLEAAMMPNEFAGRNFRPRPLFMNGEFVGGYFYNMFRIAPNGDEIQKDAKSRMIMVAGPVLFKENILLGSYTLKINGDVNVGVVYLREPTGQFKEVWSEDISDDSTATGDIVVDGDTIYASSNRTVTALDANGKQLWSAEGKDGALSSSSMRGVRFFKSFGYHYWGGDLMTVVGDRLCLSTRREIARKTWVDVITVLDKKDGSYVRTIDMQKDLIDMLASGGRLVVATSDGVKFLALD
jgi:putative pyrroloquinoline-quinone binding quinoprotein